MVTIFFSYSHRDENWRNELEVHLSALQRKALINTWHDRRIVAGDVVDHSISEQLEHASIILLLVSPYFIASDYCYDVEMSRAMERHSSGDARVIPVILEPCDWHDLPFGRLLATPTDGKPVSTHGNPHEAFLEIVKAIKSALPKSVPTRQPVDSSAASESAEVLPRSSNLRVRQQFTDENKDRFLTETFEYVACFFEGSVQELAERYADLTGQYRRVDANRFTATLYRQGEERASCTIWSGSDSGVGSGIYYSHGMRLDGSSYNESLHVQDDGYALYFYGMGFTNDHSEQLRQRGAAEHLWGLFIEHLQ